MPLPAKISAQSICFMQGANGQQIDLGSLCRHGSSPSQATSTAAGVFQVPIKRRVSGIPTVDVTFAGKQTFEMLFDTGASHITITPNMAEAIGVKKERAGLTDTAGGLVKTYSGRISSVQVGNLAVKNVEISVNPALGMMGLLGQNFFHDHDITIKQKVIEFRPRQ